MLPTILSIAVPVIIGFLLITRQKTWKHVNHFVTLVHELGHAGVGFIFGAKVGGIKINGDGSGVTTTSHPAQGFFLGRIATLLAGYTAPVVIGSLIPVLAWRFGSENTWAGIAALSLLAVAFMRNIFGLFVSLLFAALCGSVFYFYDTIGQTIASSGLYLISCILVLGGIKGLQEVVHLRKTHHDEGSDPQALRSLTGIPVIAWEASMITISAAPVIIGAIYFITKNY